MCSVCAEANATKLPHNTTRERATRPLELVHIDVGGPISPETYDGKRYYLLILDDYTHLAKTFLMKHNSKSADFIKQYLTESENKLGLKAAKIRCDIGGEFLSIDLKDWCKTKMIQLDYSIVPCDSDVPALFPDIEQYVSSSKRMDALKIMLESRRAKYFSCGRDPEWLNGSPTRSSNRAYKQIPASLCVIRG